MGGENRVPFRRFVAGLIVCLFILNSLAWPLPEITERAVPPSHFSVPAKLGTLEDYYAPYAEHASPFIIHIQDAHTSPEAQKRIRDILKWLGRKKPLLIALEGSLGPLHPEYLDFFPNYPRVNDALVQDLVEESILSGPELFAWERYQRSSSPPDGRIQFVGIETPELYQANLKAYCDFFRHEEEITKKLKEFRGRLEFAQTKFFNPELRKFLREVERRKEGEYRSGISSPDLAAYLRFLAGAAFRHLRIDLRDRFEQIRFPNLTRLLFLIENGEKMSRQRSFLQSEIDSKKLFQEMGILEKGIRQKLTQRPSEQVLLSLRDDFKLLEKLFHLEATREEYGEILGRRGEISPGVLQKRLDAVAGRANASSASLSKRYPTALRFYHLAEKRNLVLLENTLREAQRIKKYSKEEPLVVLVTGGFHTGGLTRLMREKNIAHAVIAPRMMKVDSSQTRYHQLMTGKWLAAHSALQSSHLAWARILTDENLRPRFVGVDEQGKNEQEEIFRSELRNAKTYFKEFYGFPDKKISEILRTQNSGFFRTGTRQTVRRINPRGPHLRRAEPASPRRRRAGEPPTKLEERNRAEVRGRRNREGDGFARGILTAAEKEYREKLFLGFKGSGFSVPDGDALLNALVRIREDSLGIHPEFFMDEGERQSLMQYRAFNLNPLIQRIQREKQKYIEKRNSKGKSFFKPEEIHGPGSQEPTARGAPRPNRARHSTVLGAVGSKGRGEVRVLTEEQKQNLRALVAILNENYPTYPDDKRLLGKMISRSETLETGLKYLLIDLISALQEKARTDNDRIRKRSVSLIKSDLQGVNDILVTFGYQINFDSSEPNNPFILVSLPESSRRAEVRSKVKELIEKARLTPEVLKDPLALKQALNVYNAKVGGVEELVKNKTEQEIKVTPEIIPVHATSEEEAEYLHFVKDGKRAFTSFGAGRATRMEMPAIFDKLGIAGLTGKILKVLPRHKNAKEEEFAEAAALVERAANGVIEDLDDLSKIQRDLLQLRYQLEPLLKKHPESNMKLEDLLKGINFIAIVNEGNQAAIAKQLAAIRFAGLNPNRIFLLLQEEIGGEEILSDGTTRWFEDEKWPEGHGVPLIDMRERPSGVYRVDGNGNLVEQNHTLTSLLKGLGVQRTFFSQINDYNLLKDATLVERHVAATRLFEKTGAKMAMEAVKNSVIIAGKKQKGGNFFSKNQHAVLRDTVAMNTTGLEPHAFPDIISRMLYDLMIEGIEQADLSQVPVYANLRTTHDKRNILTREIYSGDFSSAIPAGVIEQEGYELNTVKARERIPVALAAYETQDAQAGFQELAHQLFRRAEVRSFEWIPPSDYPLDYNFPFDLGELTQHWKRWRRAGGKIEGIKREELTPKSLVLEFKPKPSDQYVSESMELKQIAPTRLPREADLQMVIRKKKSFGTSVRELKATINLTSWDSMSYEGKIIPGTLQIKFMAEIQEDGRPLPPFRGGATLRGEPKEFYRKFRLSNEGILQLTLKTEQEKDPLLVGYSLDKHAHQRTANGWLEEMGFSIEDRIRFVASRAEVRPSANALGQQSRFGTGRSEARRELKLGIQTRIKGYVSSGVQASRQTPGQDQRVQETSTQSQPLASPRPGDSEGLNRHASTNSITKPKTVTTFIPTLNRENSTDTKRAPHNISAILKRDFATRSLRYGSNMALRITPAGFDVKQENNNIYAKSEYHFAPRSEAREVIPSTWEQKQFFMEGEGARLRERLHGRIEALVKIPVIQRRIGSPFLPRVSEVAKNFGFSIPEAEAAVADLLIGGKRPVISMDRWLQSMGLPISKTHQRMGFVYLEGAAFGETPLLPTIHGTLEIYGGKAVAGVVAPSAYHSFVENEQKKNSVGEILEGRDTTQVLEQILQRKPSEIIIFRSVQDEMLPAALIRELRQRNIRIEIRTITAANLDRANASAPGLAEKIESSRREIALKTAA